MTGAPADPRHDRGKEDRNIKALAGNYPLPEPCDDRFNNLEEKLDDLHNTLDPIFEMMDEGVKAAAFVCRVASAVRFLIKFVVIPGALLIFGAYVIAGGDMPDWLDRLQEVVQ